MQQNPGVAIRGGSQNRLPFFAPLFHVRIDVEFDVALSDPGKNRFAYMLEGLDPQFIETGAERRFATYTSLTPGDYRFRVKGADSDGVWSDEVVIDLQISCWPICKRT